MPTTTLSNKLIAVLLSFALVFSFTPSIAFAENEANSQTTAEEAGSDGNNTNENTADSSLVDRTNPSDSSASRQNNSISSSSAPVSGSDEQTNSNARTASSDNDQANTKQQIPKQTIKQTAGVISMVNKFIRTKVLQLKQ